jgi:hypothetical protein
MSGLRRATPALEGGYWLALLFPLWVYKLTSEPAAISVRSSSENGLLLRLGPTSAKGQMRTAPGWQEGTSSTHVDARYRTHATKNTVDRD